MATREQASGLTIEDGAAVALLHAPQVELPDTSVRRRATSRTFLLTVYCLLLLLIALRVPQNYRQLQQNVPADLAAAIHDEAMEALALKVGVFLALVVTALAMAVFFALATVLEKRLFTGGLRLGRTVSVGLYVLVVTLCVVPVQAAGALFDVVDPRRSLLVYTYVGCVGLATPLLFRRAWRSLPGQTIAVLFGTSVGLAALTVIG